MRIALALIAAVVLAGCTNQVHSERPLFTARDSQGLPKVRPGVWLMDDPDCKVDRAAPVETWPRCAQHMTVTSENLAELEGLERDNRLAAGDPMIFQMGEGEGPFSYTAIEPTRFDDQGRMVAFDLWGVMCGPPPADNRRGQTKAPMRGFRLGDERCYADKAADVRAAAKPSKAWVEFVLGVRWVR